MKKLFLFGVLWAMALGMVAQTVVWQMKPADYSGITRMGVDLYKVTQGGKIGLITSDGTLVAPARNENIGMFYEHKALLTYTDEHGECVSGCLTDNGKYYNFKKKYYTLNGQKFFSDGVLSVSDEVGQLGYVDERGNAVCGFDGAYSRIKPFTEGYAAVLSKKKKRYVLINKNGDEMKFIYGGNGVGAAIGGCTNVYNGKAYVYDEYGEKEGSFYLYDASANSSLKKTSRVKDTTKDYLFCYSSITGRTKNVPFVENKYTGSMGLSPSLENGLYGYVSNGNVVLPYQLDEATQFEDDLAVVSVGGRYGILKYVEGSSFNAIAESRSLGYYAGNSVKCNFTVDIPAAWSEGQVEVVVKDANGLKLPVVGKAGSNYYSFEVKPGASSKGNYELEIFSEGLKLYERTLEYSFVRKEKCKTCGKDKDQCAYHGKHPAPAPSPSAPVKGNKKERVCPTCGKKISECKYKGVH